MFWWFRPWRRHWWRRRFWRPYPYRPVGCGPIGCFAWFVMILLLMAWAFFVACTRMWW
ncbi:MAG: hypothetical protein ACP5Q1_08450 [Anaerolineae bacterium]